MNLIFAFIIFFYSLFQYFFTSPTPVEPPKIPAKIQPKIQPKEYVLLTGSKPTDAEIHGYIYWSETDKSCIKTNWLSGTKYLSTYTDKIEFISYSKDKTHYEIKLPISSEHSDLQCNVKINKIIINAKAKIDGKYKDFAKLYIYISKPFQYDRNSDISNNLPIKSVCNSDVTSNNEWSPWIHCDYFVGGKKIINARAYISNSVTMSRELYKHGTVITYDIIPGEHYLMPDKSAEVK